MITGLVPKQKKKKQSFLSGVGDSRATGMWSCPGNPNLMTYGEAMQWQNNPAHFYMGSPQRCFSMDPPAPAAPPPPAYSAPAAITLTQIQAPVQTQASGQETGIGNRGAGEVPYSNRYQTAPVDNTATILDAMTRLFQPQAPAPMPSGSSVSVSTGGGGEPAAPGETVGQFLEKNKLWVAGGLAAVLLTLIILKKKNKR